MKLHSNTPALLFDTKDVFDNSFSLSSLKGQKVLLSFMRFAGCPVCNLRVHELKKNMDRFEQQNIKVVLVYESDKELMREYLKEENYPFIFIADSENKLYDLYSVETSILKFLKSFFNGAISKVLSGKKLFKKTPAIDGKITRIGAEFLIDESGMITIAHYARYMGDELGIESILKK